jgi:hypothetical protein
MSFIQPFSPLPSRNTSLARRKSGVRPKSLARPLSPLPELRPLYDYTLPDLSLTDFVHAHLANDNASSFDGTIPILPSRFSWEQSLEQQEPKIEYPTGIRLWIIVASLAFSIFLIALDLVGGNCLLRH